MGLRSALLGCGLIFGLAACAPTAPYRVDSSPCRTPGLAGAGSQCGSHAVEVTDRYTLGFVEFDDQGWLHPDRPNQMEEVFATLDKEADDPDNNLLVLVFVHGWRHNAAGEDANVESFRRTLAAMYDLDNSKGAASRVRADAAGARAAPLEKPRKVVGIYVGWRGKSLQGPDLWEVLSFYDRKFTADLVAKGSMRELFARLRQFQRKFDPVEAAKKQPVDPKVRMAIFGHSFGGLAVYNAMSQYLLEAAIAAEGSAAKVHPFADLVMLINPAFEGTRYEPLHRVARRGPYQPGQPPVFVAVTSDDDAATRVAFPVGRWINTVFERENSREEKEANVHTVGHIPRYRTHVLTQCGDADRQSGNRGNTCTCPPGWTSSESGISDQVVAVEETKAAEFRKAWAGPGGGLEAGWVRYFCGDLKLTHLAEAENRHPDSPFWMVYTDRSVIQGHSGFDNPTFQVFVRQLFHDTWPR